MPNTSLMHFRREYLSGELLEQDLLEDPHLQFLVWMEDAIRSGVDDPNAMALATTGAAGMPAVRIVLLKDARPGGLIFLSNYHSRKGQELNENPNAAALFFWPGLERQVRVEGFVTKLPAEESDAFFNARPPESRIAAIISDQSRVVPDRDFLESRFESFKADPSGNIPRPEHWGGYLLKPNFYEFWQGRENRLHDRLRYTLHENEWKVERLAP